MSDFKANDNLECIQSHRGQLTAGKKYTVISISDDGRYVRVKTDNGHTNGFDDSYFILSTTKPAKKHTETERRKAAKDVRAARDKFLAAMKKAESTGIDIVFTNGLVRELKIEMSFSPETPKKRVY